MKLQQGHGGWNPRMAEYLAKIGTVHRITEKGDIRYSEIQFHISYELLIINIILIKQSTI